MYAEVLSTPARAADAAGNAYANATWQFYAAGTTTPLAAFASPALTTPLPNPVVADANGLFPSVYFDPALSYRGVCQDAAGTVTLHDVDPINASLWQELALAGGAARIGFLQSGTGAVLRSVTAKLANDPIDVEDFGPIGTADDTAVFQAAYDAAAASQRPLRLPAGWFYVSGLVFHTFVTVEGAGPGITMFRTTGNGQTVITVSDDYSPSYERNNKWKMSGFGIDVSSHTGCTGLYTERMIRTVIERFCILGDDFPPFSHGNVGWRSVGDQFCTFREVVIEWCERGLVMTSHITAGGGNNNHFDGLIINACRVNAMIYKTATYPMMCNQFTNISLQASAHCSLYINGVTSCLFTMLVPEGDTSSQATVTYEGLTIKRGTVHADNRTTARFDGYDHENNDPLMRVTADNHSSLEFSAAGGAAVNTEADSTSSIVWEGRWGNASALRNTRVSLAHVGNAKSIYAWHPASGRIDTAFPNECLTPVAVPVHQHFGTSSRMVADSQTCFAREVTFIAQAGNTNANTIWARVIPANFLANETAWGAILLKSDRDTQIGFNFAQSLVAGVVDLKAGQWVRLLVSNHNYTGATRFGSIALWPVAADQPVLRLAQPIGLRSPSGQIARQLSEEHRFNPMDPAGMVLRQSAAPTTGSWTAGSQVLAIAPAAGAAPGWVCVASGTPGTWKAMAPLAV